MLRLFESFLESAPQVVLQLYIMVATNDENLFTGIACIVSLISLCWAMVAYNRAHRRVRADKNSVSIAGAALQTIWRIGMISSRVVALVLFASAFRAYTFLVVGIHWLAMVAWVYLQQTDFCDSWLEERLFNCVVATVYIFCFFNLKEGNTRYRISIFYLVVAVENVALLLLWHHFGMLEDWYTFLGFTVVFGGFIIGVTTMILYYKYFHPRGAISFCNSAPRDKNDICQHGKSNRLSTLGHRHDNLDAEIFRRSRTPSPQNSPHDEQAGHCLEGPYPDMAVTPHKYSPPKTNPDCLDWRTVPPLRSKSLSCLLSTEKECLNGRQFSQGTRSLQCLEETGRPSKLSSFPPQKCPESCTCSFQAYELSGFATDLADRFDRCKELALAESLLSDESKLSLYSARPGAAVNQTPCRACLNLGNSQLKPIASVGNRFRSRSQPSTPSVTHWSSPAYYEIHQYPHPAVHLATSTEAHHPPTPQNAVIPESTDNAMEISRASADLPPMPSFIDSPQTAGKLNAYEIQKIYDQILEREPLPRVSKRQLKFDKDLEDCHVNCQGGPISNFSEAFQNCPGAVDKARQPKSQFGKDAALNITKCNQLLDAKLKASARTDEHKKKPFKCKLQRAEKPEHDESESFPDIYCEQLITSEAKQPENERRLSECVSNVADLPCDSAPDSEDYRHFMQQTNPGACPELGTLSPEVLEPNQIPQQAGVNVSALAGPPSPRGHVVPNLGGSHSTVACFRRLSMQDVAENDTLVNIPVVSKISHKVQGGENITPDPITGPTDETDIYPFNQTSDRRSVCPKNLCQVSTVGNLKEEDCENRMNAEPACVIENAPSSPSLSPCPFEPIGTNGNKSNHLSPTQTTREPKPLEDSTFAGDSRKNGQHFKKAQRSVLLASGNKNPPPAPLPVPSSPRGASPKGHKARLGQTGACLSLDVPIARSGQGKENNSPLTPLSARLALLSPTPNPSPALKKPPRKSLGRIPTNLVADKVALFNN
ncbi:uncharacterized protein LOC110979885 isoform X2 [Acanthaster planci]|nr:uncharacterized protein LOC110979885 isoform X2 [Acanthaster planci]